MSRASGPGDDQTSYDPDLPAKIRREISDRETLPTEPMPLPPPPRSRFILAGMGATALLTALVIQQGWHLDSVNTAEGAMQAARDHAVRGAWSEVQDDLAPLRADGTLPAEGRLLDETSRAMLALGEAEASGDWLKAYDTGLLLARLWTREGALRIEIERRLDRARAEVMAGQRLTEAMDLLAQGNLDAGLDALDHVPAGTACAEAARQEAGRARALRDERAHTEARAAMAAGDWSEASACLARCENSDADLAARIAEGVRQAALLGRARDLLTVLRTADAQAALDAVDPTGPLGPAREALRRDLEAAQPDAMALGEARRRFDAGQGESALEALRSGTSPALTAARGGIRDTLAAYQAVLDALDRGDDLGALEALRRLGGLPLAEGNWYRIRAEAARPPLERKVAALAEKAVADGVAAFRARRFAEARAAFDRAGRACPAHPVIPVYARRLIEVGEDLFRDAYVLRAFDPQAARARLEEALACLPEDHPTAAKAREALP